MDLFRFIINFGENYYQSTDSILAKILFTFLPIFFSNSFSFLVALYMFNRQNNKKVEEESSRLSEVREYLYYCLLSIFQSTKDQILILTNRIIKYEKETNNNKKATHDPMVISIGLSLPQFEKIDVKDTFKIFVTNGISNKDNRIRYYQLLYGGVEQLKKISEGLQLTNDSSVKLIEKNAVLIMNEIHKINNVVKDFAFEIVNWVEEKNKRLTYISGVNKIWAEYYSQNDGSFEHIKHKLITPLQSICLTDNLNEPETKLLLDACQVLNNKYDIIIENKKVELSNLKLWKKDLEDFIQVLENLFSFEYPEKIKR